MNENEAKALFHQAADVYKDGDHKDALKIFDRLDAAFPNNVLVLYPRARCLAKLGRTDEAVALCDVLITKFGHAPAHELRTALQPEGAPTLAAPQAFEDVAFDALDFDIDDKLASAFERPAVTKSRQLPSPMVIGGIVVGVAVVFFGVYAIFGGTDDSGSGSSAGAPPSATGSTTASLDAMPPIDTSRDPELVRVSRSESSDGVTVNASVEYGVWTNCGSYDTFLAKFAACEPAAIRMTAMGMFVMEYWVLGKKDGVCRIEMRAVKMPMYESWTGKSMTCPCDNSLDFIVMTEQLSPIGVMEGTLHCEGALFDAMKEMMSQYEQ